MAEMTAAGTVAFSEMYMGAGRSPERRMRAACAPSWDGAWPVDRRNGGRWGRSSGWPPIFAGRSRTIPESGFRWRPMPSILVVRRSSPPCGELAQERGWLFHTHASETESEHRECVARHGMTPVALLEHLGCLSGRAVLAHCVHVTEEDMGILAQRRAAVAHCPESNLKLGSGMAPAAALRKRGVTVCMGTDGAASNNDLDLLSETRTAAFCRRGWSGTPGPSARLTLCGWRRWRAAAPWDCRAAPFP